MNPVTFQRGIRPRRNDLILLRYPRGKTAGFQKCNGMNFFLKLILKIALNAAALYGLQQYFDGFRLTGGWEAFLVGAAVLALLNTFLRPVLKLISAPLLWLTFGLFHFVINIALLWIADQLLAQLAISDLQTLFFTSIIIALVNALF